MFDTLNHRFGLYVHWPFCAAKCPYCDFNSHVTARVDYERWERTLRSEIRRVAAETPDRLLSTVFFGGGTPSLMPPALVGAVLEEAQKGWAWANDIEITLEANPTSIEIESFAGFQAAGVNRVSMGVQALNDADLRRLGRMHSADEALRALEIAQTNFDRVSIDLIYARQDQSEDAWSAELRRAISLGLNHMSLYQLTIEPGTVFAKQFERGRLKGLPDEDLSMDLWNVTQSMCASAGLPAYETSNHAAPGQEAQHNLIYWTGGDWAAIGPGAHGRVTIDRQRLAFDCIRMPQMWLESVEKRGHGERERSVLQPDEIIDERVLMGLRLARGIPLDELSALGWTPPAEQVAQLEELGYLTCDESLRVTEAGKPLLNSILDALLT